MADKIVFHEEIEFMNRANIKADIVIPRIQIEQGIIPEFDIKKKNDMDLPDPNQGDMLTDDLHGNGPDLNETYFEEKDDKKNTGKKRGDEDDDGSCPVE